MTDLTVAETLPEPGARGALDVRLRVIERVARRACLDVPGTVAQGGALGGALGRVTGQTSPKVDVTVHGRSARIEVRVACSWPAPVARIAESVRERVLAETSRITGVAVVSVDVDVQVLSAESGASAGGRVS